MNRSADEKSDSPAPRARARAVLKKTHWPAPLIWVVPALAAVIAAFYFYSRQQDRGPEITLTFTDTAGLKPGNSTVNRNGVPIGLVTSVELAGDLNHVLVHVELKKSDGDFAEDGARYWIVRPEISTREISGLATVLSGPYIEAEPGHGAARTEFIALQNAPATLEPGVRVILKAPRIDHLDAGAPVYFRGLPVGVIEQVVLSPDAAGVQLHAFIRQHYAPIVKTGSEFWIVSAVDLKGNLLSGVQMKVESVSSLLSGGVEFATPEKNMGDTARDGAEFPLYDEPKKDWLDWSPKINVGADPAPAGTTNPTAAPPAGAQPSGAQPAGAQPAGAP